MNSTWKINRIRMCVAAVVTLALLPNAGTGQQRNEFKPEELPKAVLNISQFKKLDGPARMDSLQELLPELLHAHMLRYKWLQSGTSFSSTSKDSLASAVNDLPTYILDGNFIAVADQIRVDITLRNQKGDPELQSTSVFTDETMFEEVERLGQQISDSLRIKLASQAGKRRARFLIARFRSNSGAAYQSLGGFLGPTIANLLSKAKLENATFLTGENTNNSTEDAIVTGTYTVIEDEKSVRLVALVQERGTGATFHVEAEGPDSQLSRVTRMLSLRILEIARARVAPTGEWNTEPISLVNASREEYLTQAKKYEESGQPARAILMYRKAMEKQPENIQARWSLAKLYSNQQDYLSAISEYHGILVLNSNLPDIHYELAAANIKAGNSQEAKVEIEQARSLSKGDPRMEARLCLLLGDIALIENNNSMAIKSYTRALELSGDSPEPYRAVASALRVADNLPSAQDFLSKAHLLFPADRQVTVDLASLFNEQGQRLYKEQKYAEALEQFNRAMHLGPEDPRVAAETFGFHGIIVGSFLPSPDRKKGIQELQKSVELESSEWNNRLLGDLCKEDGDYPNAVKYLQQAIQKGPTAIAYTLLAATYRLQHKYDEAISAVQQALKLRPENPSANAELGEIYRVFKKKELAVSTLNKYISMQPKDDYGYLALADVYEQDKLYGRALEVLQNGLKQLPDSSALYVQACDGYRLQKDYKAAMGACERAVSLDPKDPDAYWEIGKIQVEQKQYEKALATARKVIELKGDGYSLIADAYHGLNKDAEAVKVFKDYLKQKPQDTNILIQLALVYQERLFNYAGAYDVSQQVYLLQPGDLTVRQDFAETNLTTERYDQALSLANEVLDDRTIAADEKLSMKLIAVAALLSQRKTAEAFSELGEFIRYHESITDYEQTWLFDGVKQFVKNSRNLAPPAQKLLLDMIEILQVSDKPKADEKVRELKRNLQSFFTQLQATA